MCAQNVTRKPLASSEIGPTAGQHYGATPNLSASLEKSLGPGQHIESQMESQGPERPTLLQRAARVIPCLGILMAVCASFFLGTTGMLVKLIDSIDGIQVAVLRASIQLIVYATIICFRTKTVYPPKGEILPVMGRAILGGISITASFHCLKLISLGDATTIRFSMPIWTLIIGYFFLGESCSVIKIFAVMISVFGVVLVAKPEDVFYLWSLVTGAMGVSHRSETISAESTQVEHDPVRQLEGSLLALISSVCLSMSIISMRLCKKTPAEITIFWLSVMSILTGFCVSIYLEGGFPLPDNLRDVLYVLLNGICGSLGQWFITSSLKIEQSGVIALARTCDIEVAFLYSALLLHEHIRVTSIVGSVLVCSGVLAVLVPKFLEARQRRANRRKDQIAKDINGAANGANGPKSHDDEAKSEQQANNNWLVVCSVPPTQIQSLPATTKQAAASQQNDAFVATADDQKKPEIGADLAANNDAAAWSSSKL